MRSAKSKMSGLFRFHGPAESPTHAQTQQTEPLELTFQDASLTQVVAVQSVLSLQPSIQHEYESYIAPAADVARAQHPHQHQRNMKEHWDTPPEHARTNHGPAALLHSSAAGNESELAARGAHHGRKRTTHSQEHEEQPTASKRDSTQRAAKKKAPKARPTRSPSSRDGVPT